MELFCVKPTVHYLESFSEFVKAFSLDDNDLILTEKILFDGYISRTLVNNCHIILKDNYDMGEPKEEVIDAILKDTEKLNVKRIIAVGGGSVIDIAKLLCIKDARPIRAVIERKKEIVIDKELIVIPTTCGTGSEVTFGGIVTMTDTGYKTAIIDPILSSNHAVLIPELLYSLPDRVFLHCSVDALGHAMEAYVSATRSNEMVRAVGGRAIKLIVEGYGEIILHGKSVRNNFMKQFVIGSCLGGMAVNNGGAGPVHALAYPLGEIYKMSHGESIYQFLTEVFLHYERIADGPILEEIRQIIEPVLKETGLYTGSVFSDLENMINKIYPSRPLAECGMKQSDIMPFVENIFEAKQRLLAASYASFTKDDAEAVYLKRL